MNCLYHFNVNKEIETEVQEDSTDDKGEKITITKKVKKNEKQILALKKPTRKLYESAELYYAVKLSEGIKAGLLTQPLLAKRYKNDGGPMSEPEKKRYAEVYYQLLIKQEELEKLRLNLEGHSEDYRAKLASEVMTDIISSQEEIQHFENQQSSLFDQTAENRAKNMTIMWWVLNLAYTQDKHTNEYLCVFGEGNHDEKLEAYDEIEELNEPFWTEVVKKFAYFATFWYLNGLATEDEFKQVENMYNKDNDEDGEEVEESEAEEPKAEEPKAEEPKAEEAKAEEPKAEEPKARPQERAQGRGAQGRGAQGRGGQGKKEQEAP